MTSIRFILNGQPREFTPRPGETLLQALRERFQIRSTKNGCAPQGQCGACLALIDGKAKTTCAIPAEKANGTKILTLEGVEEDERQLIARCFTAAAGVQCGFCIPGIAMRTHWLLERNPDPTRGEIAKALEGHLCRCTGYLRIFDAVEMVAKTKRGEMDPPAPETDGRVGRGLDRWHSEKLVLGEHEYVDDMTRPGMLHGALVLSEHPRARVVGIDMSAALQLPGVVRVFTAADVPGKRWYGLILSDWPGLVSVGEEVRCVGDIVAVVAAEDEATAREAARMVRVDYEILTPVLDPQAALEADAPQVNPTHENLLSRTVIQRGNAERALRDSAHVVKGHWETQRIEHLFLEPEACLAEPLEDGGLRFFTQGQGIFDDRHQVAAFLSLPQDKVQAELAPNGGAFGGKEDMSVQAQTALITHFTRRPAKITLNREESVRIHPKRHPIAMDYEVGCDAEGRLTAVRARMIGDTGAYASVGAKVLERAAGHSCGAYRIPHVDVEAKAVSTNNPPCGAMRGFGANQAHFAIEACIDLLADKCGLDGWEIRRRNALQVGDSTSSGQILEKSVGLVRTLEAVKDVYLDARRRGQAVGIACGIKNSGIGNGAKEWGKARLVVEDDGRVTVFNGFTEMGQGLLTVLIQFAVEVTGLPASLFNARVSTDHEMSVGQTTGSRGTLLGGRAVIDAAKKLRADLNGGLSLDELKGHVYIGETIIDDTTSPEEVVEKVKTHTTYGFATQVVLLDAEGRLEKVIAAHDVGRVINPKLCAGQIEGAVHMGLGYALSEELPCPGGWPATYKLRELGAIRSTGMPEVEVILVEDPEPEGPFGAKGVGEIGLVPTAAAVAGALAAHDGIRRTVLPMKDSPAFSALRVGRIRKRHERIGAKDAKSEDQ